MPSKGDMMAIHIKSTEVALKTNVKKTMLTISEWIDRMALEGLADEEIERRVKQAFLQGGGPFATFRHTFLRRTAGLMNRIERTPRTADNEAKDKYTWICMHTNSCDDCLELHGETKTWSEWLDEGLPGSGHTQCQDNCNCELVEEGKALSDDFKSAIDLAEERRKEIVEEGGAVHVGGERPPGRSK